MAKLVLKDGTFLFGKVEIGGSVQSVDLGAEAATVDTTNYGSSGWREHLSALKQASWVFECFREEQSPDQEAWDGLSNVPAAATKTRAVAEDDVAYGMRAVRSEYSLRETIGESAGLRLSLTGDAPMVRGLMLAVRDSVSASGNTTANNAGSVASGQSVYAGFHVLSASGGGTLDVKVQSDDAVGFASPADRITFTQETDLTTNYQWSSATGPITDDWWRIDWTVSGTFSFRVFFGIQ